MDTAYMTVTQISRITGINVEIVRKWCRSGRLRAFKPGGGKYLVSCKDFEAFMENHANTTTTAKE